ncbi:acyltransferase [Marinobacter adhaerens]|uniref:Acyltransferase n=1 Tax=Marinobacter adhaerens TaxID=1033846 RepID=A0A851HKP8_9GAMM|nr:acyltransferase [Marinobacter adhaerens]NWN90429.1 acyltransferase [Marinobacter adhaerens]
MRNTLKRIIKNTFLLLTLPLYALYWVLSCLGNPDSTFQSFSQALSLIPGKVGVYVRAAFYRLACPDTSDDIVVGFLTILSHRDTSIHKGVYIGPQCNIGKCTLGKNTLLGSGIHVLSGKQQHQFKDPNLPIKEQGGAFKKIKIGADCWIGNNSVVMCDVANHSVVAAGAIVAKDLTQEGAVAAGNPAAAISQRNLEGLSE